MNSLNWSISNLERLRQRMNNTPYNQPIPNQQCGQPNMYNNQYRNGNPFQNGPSQPFAQNNGSDFDQRFHDIFGDAFSDVFGNGNGKKN